MNYTIKTLTTTEELHQLYSDSAFTFEGFSIEPDNIEAFLSALDEEGLLADKETVVSVVKGNTMNANYELTSSNLYPADLNIVAVELKYLQNIQKLAMFKLNIGARWFDDIVENNIRREED